MSRRGLTARTVSIMSCETFAPDLPNLPSISFSFRALNKEQLIEKVQQGLQLFSIANALINELNDIIMKYMEKILETHTLRRDNALAPAPAPAPSPVYAPARASATVSTDTNKTFAFIVKTTQSILVKLSDGDVAVARKGEMMSKANEALKKVNVKSARMTNKGTLIVEVSSENDRESAVTRLKEGFSGSYVAECAKMLIQKPTVVGNLSDMPEDEIIDAICEKSELLNQVVESS